MKRDDWYASGTRDVPSPGSREPDPQAVPALSGFDPSRESGWWYWSNKIKEVAGAGVLAVIVGGVISWPFGVEYGNQLQYLAAGSGAGAYLMMSALRCIDR